nr:hypothetical protein [Tanacetum cinerariifolium]
PELDIAQSSRKTTIVIPTGNVATTKVQGLFFVESLESGKSTSFPSVDGSPGGARPVLCGESGVREIDLLPIRRRVTRRYLSAGVGSDQQLPPRHPGRMPRHGRSHNTIGVAKGSQLRLRFKQKTKNLGTLHEAEVDMKKATEAKNAELAKELESLRVQFLDLQDMVDHIVTPRYFLKLRHLPNDDFLGQYNMNLARQVAMGSQLSLRFEQEHVSDLQAQVTGEERIKVAFEEFKKYEDEWVNSCCAKMDARLDALSKDFDEELYPHMLTAIEGLMKGISEGLAHGIEHEKAGLDLEVAETYDPQANCKYLKALQELKELKYPIVDQV